MNDDRKTDLLKSKCVETNNRNYKIESIRYVYITRTVVLLENQSSVIINGKKHLSNKVTAQKVISQE